MTDERPLDQRPAARPVEPSAADSPTGAPPPKPGMGCFGIGCIGVIVVTVVVVVGVMIAGAIGAGSSSSSSTTSGGGTSSTDGSGSSSGSGGSNDPIEQARVVLGGAYTYAQVKDVTDSALRATGTAVSDDSRSRAWSAVLAVTKDLDAEPMQVMLCVVDLGPASGMDFPDTAALCATELHLTD